MWCRNRSGGERVSKVGDRLEFKVSGGIINIIAQVPSAEDDYTPAQRRAILAEIAEAQKGPYYGPFDTADAASKFLRKEIRKRVAAKIKPKRRLSFRTGLLSP